MDIKILFEDKDFIVAVKPSGMSSQPDKTGDKDMVSFLKKETESAIFLINRLDRPVSGIMIFGKNEKTAQILTRKIQNKEVIKKYYALICGEPEEMQGRFVDYLLKNQKENTSKAVSKGTKGAKEAKLTYEVIKSMNVETWGIISLVSVQLITGRHHQIRVQFSSRNLPLFGDTKYNSALKGKRGRFKIGLCSSYIAFAHPYHEKLMEFSITPEGEAFDLFLRV